MELCDHIFAGAIAVFVFMAAPMVSASCVPSSAGDHATTQMCMQALMDMDLQGKDVIDYGTGSGILAMAALLFGARQAVGKRCRGWLSIFCFNMA